MQWVGVDQLNEYVVVIPAFNPDRQLVTLVHALRDIGLTRITVIDDGSHARHAKWFKEIDAIADVVSHSSNRGKGAALKTGIATVLEKAEGVYGVITVDADGQHLPEDVRRMYIEASRRPNELIMGCRDFSGTNIPFRSRFGNQATRLAMRLGSGLALNDTQTGLRAIPLAYAKELLSVPGERYEFEMNMLTGTKRAGIDIHQVPIQTVYLEENASSHFRPIVDSIRIYRMFLAYALSSISSFLLDLGLYALLVFVFDPWFETAHIVVATFVARVLSSLFNYKVNRHVVFQSKAPHTIIKYFSLVVIQMGTSALLVFLLFSLFRDGEVLFKLAVDGTLFVLSYYIQKKWIFQR